MSQTAAVSHLAFRRLTHQGQVLAVRARYTGTDFGSSEAYVAETFGRTPAYLCVLQLHDFPAANSWADGIHRSMPRLPGGSSTVLDLRHAWRTEVPAPFDNVHINVTQSTLDEIAEDGRHRTIELRSIPFESSDDAVVRHLAQALIPALRRPHEVPNLFADHIMRATAIHLAAKYGGLEAKRAMRAGLAPWQERRARDMLLDRLDADIGIAALAAACGLSPGHFAKAFKRTTGEPPHRWLLQQRIRRACEMLHRTDHPLGFVAASCGFADQSHLTRVFKRAIGVTPGAWRRIRRS